MNSMPRIIEIAERAKAKRDPHAAIARIESEKAHMLKRGPIVLMSGDLAERERWLNEYQSLCRCLRENQAELEDAA